jgi:magnesium-protoporphyrin O-methyltransferase
MAALDYITRRGQLQTYFDRTAVDAWARLTSTAPVSRIRATVRAGRDRMRETLLGYLPPHLVGKRLLDAGCGTGALSVEASQRGAAVLAIDLSPTLVRLAAERFAAGRLTAAPSAGSIDFRVGDMFDPALGAFTHVVAMDSLIHYAQDDVVRVLVGFAARTERSIVFTFAPKTPALMLLWWVGLAFPRRDRAPAIVPISERSLRRQLAAEPRLQGWQVGRTRRVASGFYKSQAMELIKP